MKWSFKEVLALLNTLQLHADNTECRSGGVLASSQFGRRLKPGRRIADLAQESYSLYRTPPLSPYSQKHG